jgi:hypothetical protein
MKLNANKFAVAIWIATAMIVAGQLISEFYLSAPVAFEFGRFLMVLLYSLLYPAILAALGAVVHLLGEIRDRLPERSN